MGERIRYCLIFIIVSFCFLSARGQVIENYDPQISFAESEALYIAPEMAHVTVDLGTFPLVDLHIQLPANSSIFIDKVMWFYSQVDTSFSVPLQDLASSFPSLHSTREIVVYKKGLQRDEISIKKGMFGDQTEIFRLVEQPESNVRVKPVMERFFVVAALITFSFIALYKVIYPLVISFMIRPISAFSTEDYYETNSLSKFFSEEILIFLIIFNLLLMLLIMVLVFYLDFGGLKDFLAGDMNHLYFVWLSGTGVLLVISWARFVWLKISAFIFGINRFEFTHFFFMLRIVSVILVFTFILLFISIINNVQSLNYLSLYLLWAFLLVYFVGMLVLFLIMAKKLSFKNYHLFSYLCTAELVPFLVLSKLIIG